MRQRLYHRLQELEEASSRARKQREWRDAEADGAKAIRRVELFLRICGIEKGPRESLAEAWARALEITCTELRQLLAAGIDPIHKFLSERGVYEDIETRKAAGTWPGGRKGKADCQALTV